MSSKPERSDELKKRLSRTREVNITVTGRKSGRAISIPVWFVLDADKILLVPVSGSDTQWYKNVVKKPAIQIDSGGATAALRAELVGDAKQVASVVEKFRAKYGAGDIKKYYSKLDVAVIAPLR